MTKKDRIALAISAAYFLWPVGIALSGDPGSVGAGAVLLLPVVAYWGYRFVKGDISFIKMNNQD